MTDRPQIVDRRRRRKADWVLAGIFLVPFIVGAVACLIGWTAIQRLDDAERGACSRLQVQRERQNVSEAAQFLVLVQASESSTSPRARSEYARLARSALYGPPTDCDAAIDKPTQYKLRPVVPFACGTYLIPVTSKRGLVLCPDGIVLGREYADAIIQAAREHRSQPTPEQLSP